MWNRILKPLRGGQEGLDLPEASGRRCRRNFLTSRPRVGIHLMKRCHFKNSIDGSHKLYYGMRVPGGGTDGPWIPPPPVSPGSLVMRLSTSKTQLPTVLAVNHFFER